MMAWGPGEVVRPGSKVCKKDVKRSCKNCFAIFPFTRHAVPMTQPLALVFYEKLLPGSQLVNRLQDLNYRVQTANDLPALLRCAQSDGPMLVVVDLESKRDDVCRTIAALKADAATQHIPIIAFRRRRGHGAAGGRPKSRRHPGGRRCHHCELPATAFESSLAGLGPGRGRNQCAIWGNLLKLALDFGPMALMMASLIEA